MNRNLVVIAFFVLAMLCSCQPDYVPKPRGYFRIELPEKNYSLFNPEGCPFSFEIPQYARMVPDSDRLSEPCWWYLDFPRFNGEIYLSYKPVGNNLAKLIEDAHTLVYKHTVKADEINEMKVATPDKVYGIIYNIGGNAASSSQFFLTDSTRHFVRGALYFNTMPNTDSISPVLNFIRQDIHHLISTFNWK